MKHRVAPQPVVSGNTEPGSRKGKKTASVTRVAYKVYELAPMLGVDPKTVYDLINSGKLRYTRLAGGTIIVPAAALDEFLNSGDAA